MMYAATIRRNLKTKQNILMNQNIQKQKNAHSSLLLTGSSKLVKSLMRTGKTVACKEMGKSERGHEGTSRRCCRPWWRSLLFGFMLFVKVYWLVFFTSEHLTVNFIYIHTHIHTYIRQTNPESKNKYNHTLPIDT